MAATVQIHKITSTAANSVTTDITTTTNRAQTDDLVGTGSPTANPIPIPTGATIDYSYWQTTRLFVATAPAGTINNLQWYSDGVNSMGTGVTLNVQVSDPTKYNRATGTAGTTGTLLNSTNHSGLPANTSNAFTFGAASTLAVTGTITSTTGYVGQMVVYQVAVTSAAGPGTTTAETITFQYDET